MPAYHPVFVAGETVKIKPVSFLRQYLVPEWAYYNPLDQESLEFAGQLVSITSVGYFHGGGVLYNLRGIPGIWQEESLEDHMLSDVLWEGYPNPSEHFIIDTVESDCQQYVRVTTRTGLECLRKCDVDAKLEASNMREVAKLRHFRGFIDRYGFFAPFTRSSVDEARIKDKMFRQAFDLPADAPLPNDLFTAELLQVLLDVPEYPVERFYGNKPYPAAGAPGWQRAASDPAPRDEDRALQLLCDFYMRANPRQRQGVRESRSHESLYHFAHRVAIRALRRKTPADIELGLAALSIHDLAWGSPAERTHFMVHWLILRRVAMRIGCDFGALVERVAAISTPYTARAIRGHAAAPEDGSVLWFDIEEFDDEHGPTIGWRH